MNRKWMPITAGALDIIGGAFGLFWGTIAFILGTIGTLLRELMTSEFLAQIIGPIVFIAAILSIIGGIYHIKTKHWPLAITGSISTLLVTWGWFWAMRYFPDIIRGLIWIPAIATIILTIKSRNQFNTIANT